VVAGREIGGCEAICTKHKGCRAYSYRARDKLCLLGAKGIVYSDDFNYYERKGMPHEPYPDLPAGAAFSCTGSLCAPPPPAGPPKDPLAEATNNPAVKALESAEKVRMKLANKNLARAEADQAKAKAKVAAEQLKGREKIAKIRAKDKSQLTEAEKALLKAGDERISKREETLKLQFADAEIKEKAFEASGGAKRVQ